MSLNNPSQQRSLVRDLLINSRKDLWNVQVASSLALLFDPAREYIIDPILGLWTIILPPITSNIPFADAIVSTLIGLSFMPIKWFYCILPKKDEDANYKLRQHAKNDILYARSSLPKFKPPSDLQSAIRGGFAFVFSVMADLISAFMDPKKMRKWFEALGQFNAYLTASGVGKELQEAMVKPILYGRLLDNFKILNIIQLRNGSDRHERVSRCTKVEIEKDIQRGQRFMRFATAAYGTEMIKSAIDKEASEEELADEKKAIAFHSDISEDDVKLLHVQDGGDMQVLRHFVAVDHKTKSVVLALRGTLSVSGALIDMQAMDCEFCTCRAHKGIAEIADHLWAKSGDFINALFEEESLKHYDFVITGHSLGAGAACLLNIKCHVEELVKGRQVLCFGFAPPPVYCLSGANRDEKCVAAIEKAIENSICYIHDNDCVPHLSVASIRRLANLLDTVDNITEKIWFPRRFKIFWEFEAIPNLLFHEVSKAEMDMSKHGGECTMANGNKMRKLEGESEMKIPAKTVVWMRKNPDGTFEAFGCDPNEVARLNIFLCEDMISDHLPEMYEDALDASVG